MKKRTQIILAVLAILGGGFYYGLSESAGQTTYLTALIEKGKVTDTVTATGEVNAVVTVQVGSQLSGRIDELYVDFNDVVRQGQKLIRLDQKSFKAKVAEASATLTMAKTRVHVQQAAVGRAKVDIANASAKLAVLDARIENASAGLRTAAAGLKRKSGLRKKGATSIQALDEAQGRHDSAAAAVREAKAIRAAHVQVIAAEKVGLLKAEAELAHARAEVPQKQAILDIAEVELERTVILAPIDGVVIKRDVDKGQTVAASLEAPTLFTIAQDLRQMEVHARIDEADIGRITIGQRAVFSVDAFPSRKFTGKVAQIRKAPEVVNNVVTYTVLIRTGNPDLLLLPGMTATIRIVTAETDLVLKVPSAALHFQPTNTRVLIRDAEAKVAGGEGLAATVWMLDGADRPTPVDIRVGLKDIGGAEFLSGSLSEGDAVVVGDSASTSGRRFFGLRLGF
jgi:HlyD family secretion protein